MYYSKSAIKNKSSAITTSTGLPINLPVPIISPIKQKHFVDIVDQILTRKQNDPNADTTDLEREIDQLVYQLYNLTPQEIAIIEGGGGSICT
ncbi:MAG: hypothetical protein HQL06_15780 [Nitrospirae bacterium]|nr:hypothetical protein [Nitrospirota bacterium]